MRFITFALYSLKINVLNVIVHSCRTHLLDLKFIDSSAVYETSATTTHPDEYPDECFFNNITDIPYL